MVVMKRCDDTYSFSVLGTGEGIQVSLMHMVSTHVSAWNVSWLLLPRLLCVKIDSLLGGYILYKYRIIATVSKC